MLIDAGVGQYTADMSIPYMNFLPRTCDPYAQGVMQIVQGLQRLLNDRGAELEVDGGMGAATLAEMLVYTGPGWVDKSWAQIYDDVITGKKWPGWKRVSRLAATHEPMGSALTDLVTNPIVLVGAGLLAYWKRDKIKAWLA
jgi:hypothetical protein